MTKLLFDWTKTWSKRKWPPQDSAITLHHRRTFIMPTGSGVVFALILLVMLLGSINYGKSLGLVLTFVLASLGIVSILHTFRNLLHLVIQPGQFPPVFVDETAHFSLHLENPCEFTRYGLGLQAQAMTPAVFTTIPAHQRSAVSLAIPAIKRGILAPGRVKVFTQFPLGLFQAWGWLEFRVNTLVYPTPERDAPSIPVNRAGTGYDNLGSGAGNDDYIGLRNYQPGDSPRHIAWKAAARQQGLLTKQFAGTPAGTTWLNWDATVGLKTEARLSRLCRWVLDADAAGYSYGLCLPNRTIPPACSQQHKASCLAALALFGIKD